MIKSQVFIAAGVAIAAVFVAPRPAHAGWAEDALKLEADYIVNCSFTLQAKNNRQVQLSDAAYGALNNVRLVQGADWVRPGESAMAMIGLMAAAQQLKSSGESIENYDAVIDAFFQTWLLKSRAAVCEKKDDPSFGGITSDLSYTDEGALKATATNFNTGTTGAMLSAMWKYYEFNIATGRHDVAAKWLNGEAFEIAMRAGNFIERCHVAKFDMVSPSPAGGNLWINDTSLCITGLRCLSKWADTRGIPVGLGGSGVLPSKLADALAAGLGKMKDEGPTKGFFKSLNPADGSRSYDGSLDQLCFVPYETNALDPSEDFVKEISDFWTDGADGKHMTFQTDKPEQWTYFGTRWHWYEKANPESERLTPGPGLQLAKVEWKYAVARGDKTLRHRAMQRYAFANSPKYSNLWLGGNGEGEAGIPGGIVDWRLASEADNRGDAESVRAPGWQRFIDTSAYFIEVTLMAFWDKDTKYTPN